MKLGHNNYILHVLLIDFPKASTNKKGRVSSIIYDDIIDTTVLIKTIDKFCGPFLIVRIIYMLPFQRFLEILMSLFYARPQHLGSSQKKSNRLLTVG